MPTDGAESDQTLLTAVRGGDRSAFATLWSRHSRAGLVAARSFTHLAEPDDLVSEAFAKIFSTLQNGAGPTGAFRPYLYTVIRNLAVRNVRHLTLVSDVDIDTIDVADESVESVDDVLDKTLTATAFRSLPERWQTVLWYVEVEKMSAAQAGSLMSLKANAVTALVFRARQGLRSAWLQSHISDASVGEEHRFTLDRMGEYTRKALNARDTRKIDDHLSQCARCSIIASEVDGVAGRLAIVLLPLVLGGSAALAFARTLSDGGGAALLASATPTVTVSGRASAGASTKSALVVSLAAASIAIVAIGGYVAMQSLADVRAGGDPHALASPERPPVDSVGPVAPAEPTSPQTSPETTAETTPQPTAQPTPLSDTDEPPPARAGAATPTSEDRPATETISSPPIPADGTPTPVPETAPPVPDPTLIETICEAASALVPGSVIDPATGQCVVDDVVAPLPLPPLPAIPLVAVL